MYIKETGDGDCYAARAHSGCDTLSQQKQAKTGNQVHKDGFDRYPHSSRALQAGRRRQDGAPIFLNNLKTGFSMKATLMTLKTVIPALICSVLFINAAAAAAVDADAAQALAKKSGCLKCHAIAKKKDAPSYREIAGKYKGKADAEDKLYKHLTTSPKVKIDGKEETHDGLKTKDEQQIRNVVRWILTR